MVSAEEKVGGRGEVKKKGWSHRNCQKIGIVSKDFHTSTPMHLIDTEHSKWNALKT